MDLAMFAERLREVRRDFKMNQEDFAAMIKVSRASLSFYETAARTPDIITLRNLCEATGVSANYFLGMSNSKHDENANIVDTLHLSENSIKKIENDDVLQAILNCMLESDLIDKIIKLIATLREASIMAVDSQSPDFVQQYAAHVSKRELGELTYNAIAAHSASDKPFTTQPLINLDWERNRATFAMLMSLADDDHPAIKALVRQALENSAGIPRKGKSDVGKTAL